MVIDAEVATLLSLKEKYKSLTGVDLVGAQGGKKQGAQGGKKQGKAEKKKKEKKQVVVAVTKETEGEGGRKKQTKCVIY